ncbi:MAG: hypothetical protein LBD04_10380 [Synergistaceae bacterium]|nr:hypothetical protein [Synergistaceae bacterium]
MGRFGEEEEPQGRYSIRGGDRVRPVGRASPAERGGKEAKRTRSVERKVW